MWTYQGKPFDSSMIGDYVGFVYQLTDKTNGMKYIGKKGLIAKRRLPPLKGKTKRRTKLVETDWQSYCSSSEEIKLLVEQHGIERFDRVILQLCKTKGELNYFEMKYQMDLDVLLKPDEYYNAYIGGRLNRSHVRHLCRSSI